MKEIIENILDGNLEVAKQLVFNRITEKVEDKIDLFEMYVIEKFCDELDSISESSGVQKMGRRKIIRARIRKGKLQRNITKSTVPGYEMKNGRMVRMSYAERRHRKMGARLAKFKRRSKQGISKVKRQRAAMRRQGLGLK